MSRRAMLIVMSAALLWGAEVSAEPPALPESGWQWQKREKPDWPKLCFESGAAFDSSAGKLVLWGGHGPRYSGSERADTWLYDSRADKWTLAEPANRPIGACCVREVVYDEANRRTWYFGGHSYSHGWQWRAPRLRGGGVPWGYDASANTWRCARPLGGRPASPWTGAAYDADHQVVVTYAGEGFYVETVWIYDGYSNEWTAIQPKGDGPGLGGHCPMMLHDPEHHVVLMYGVGYGKDSRNELWALELSSGSWRKLGSAGGPSRQIGLFIYDPVNRVPILFGKGEDGRMAAFAYDWAGGSFKRLNATGPPPPAYSVQQGAYDPLAHRTLFANGGIYSVQNVPAVYFFGHARPKAASSAPPAPGDLRVTIDAEGRAGLTFKAVPGARRYVVHRGTGARSWQVKYTEAARTEQTRFTDAKPARDAPTWYFVQAEDAAGRAGAASMKVCTRPRPPGQPVVSLLDEKRVRIDWPAPQSPDVVGYNVYRFTGWRRSRERVEPTGLKKLNAKPLARPGLTWESAEDEAGGPVFVVRAVNRLDLESGPSAWADTIASEPTGVRARKQAGDVVVTWNANPQQSLQGYNVYRADSGGGNKDRLAKKIAGPIQQARFVDAGRGDGEVCKYYVTAVDSTGREGRASYGAWFNDNGRN